MARPRKRFDELREGDYKTMLRTVARQAGGMPPEEVHETEVLRRIARRHPIRESDETTARRLYEEALAEDPDRVPLTSGPVPAYEITRPSLTFRSLEDAREEGILGYSAVVPDILGRGLRRRIGFRLYFAEPVERRAAA